MIDYCVDCDGDGCGVCEWTGVEQPPDPAMLSPIHWIADGDGWACSCGCGRRLDPSGRQA